MQATTQRIQRTENILYSLKEFDYLTRSQLQIIHRLGKTRNACRILQRIEEDGLINSFRSESTEKVYHLNKAGREVVDCSIIRRKTHLVNHFIMRNQLYIFSGMPSTWKNEKTVNSKITCDAMYTKCKQFYICEVDNLQNFRENLNKIKKYKEIQKKTKDPFTLVWVTSTHARKIRLERHLKDLNSVVYLYSDLI